MSQMWTRVEYKLPPDGVLVDTISPGGIQQPLIYSSGLFFLEDSDVYVWYTPEFWKKIEG